MDPLLMHFIMDDDDDNDFDHLIENTSLSKSLFKNDDLICNEIKAICTEIALDIGDLKSLNTRHNNTRKINSNHIGNERISKIYEKFDLEKFQNKEFIDSDIEDDEIQKYIKIAKKRKLDIVRENFPNPRQKKLLELRMTNPFKDKSDEEFFKYLRVTRKTFLRLLDYVKNAGVFFENYSGANVPVQPEQALQMFLYYMGQRCTYKFLSQMFHASESAIMMSYMKCVDVLSGLDEQEVHWPLNKVALKEAVNKFKDISGFPNIVGSLGGCCIEMRTNKEPPAGYKIGKLRSIMYLLGVTDADHKFTYIQVGFPGTFCLQEAFESSSLGEVMNSDNCNLFLDKDTYLISDSELVLNKHLIVPYNDIECDENKCNKIFNEKLLASNTCKRTFALLKTRFRTFQGQIYGNLMRIPNVIKAGCIVHNICMDDPDDEKFILKEFTDKCENYYMYQDDTDFTYSEPNEEAINVRNAVATEIYKDLEETLTK